jgi:isopentenyl-diphosphate delta-isomerase type 1
MEYLDIVDENNNLTGKLAEREYIHKKGIWHREISVWIVNGKGEILLQKRAANKKEKPNQWGTCSGHIEAGETKEDSIIRELNEELGLEVTINKLKFMWIEKVKNKSSGRKNYHFKYMYFLKTNYKIEDYKIQTEELSEIKYISFVKIKEIIAIKDPTVTFSKQKYAFRLLQELEKRI